MRRFLLLFLAICGLASKPAQAKQDEFIRATTMYSDSVLIQKGYASVQLCTASEKRTKKQVVLTYYVIKKSACYFGGKRETAWYKPNGKIIITRQKTRWLTIALIPETPGLYRIPISPPQPSRKWFWRDDRGAWCYFSPENIKPSKGVFVDPIVVCADPLPLPDP